MCGRYSNHVTEMGVWTELLRGWPVGIELSYNIAPTQTIPVFIEPKCAAMRWGLIPHWAKEPKTKYSTFNARAESLADKPAFRHPWQQGQRCLIPAQGFFEWRAEGDTKRPYFIFNQDGGPLIFAGLWERWEGEGQQLLSCTMVTQPAEDKMLELHARQPLMLQPEQADEWLHGSLSEAVGILQTSEVKVDYYPVSRYVNSPRNQGPDLINRLSERE